MGVDITVGLVLAWYHLYCVYSAGHTNQHINMNNEQIKRIGRARVQSLFVREKKQSTQALFVCAFQFLFSVPPPTSTYAYRIVGSESRVDAPVEIEQVRTQGSAVGSAEKEVQTLVAVGSLVRWRLTLG